MKKEKMMGAFPGSPRLQKGAMVGIDPAQPVPAVVIFQYNPDAMTRTLQASAAGGDADRGEALRLKGPPQETIRLQIEIDATDQLEQGQFPATDMGIYPVLSSLELFLYPSSTRVIANEVLMNLGMIEIVPPEAPLTLFAWGFKRVLPVRLTEIAITEEAFDPSLNPIRARVSLGMRVLNYNDLGLAHPGGVMFMAHQIMKETMGRIGSFANIPALPSALGG
jgi:hypothetical protein